MYLCRGSGRGQGRQTRHLCLDTFPRFCLRAAIRFNRKWHINNDERANFGQLRQEQTRAGSIVFPLLHCLLLLLLLLLYGRQTDSLTILNVMSLSAVAKVAGSSSALSPSPSYPRLCSRPLADVRSPLKLSV